jgi:hypothetical protein
MTVEVQDPVQHHTEPSATALVGGIISDMHQLVEQQLRLTRREIEDDLRKATEAALIFGCGVGTFFLGGGVLCLALIHLLHWGVSPPGTDPALVPLWVWHAVVGVPLCVIGGVLACVGRMKFQSFDLMKNPATEALKENLEWAIAPK